MTLRKLTSVYANILHLRFTDRFASLPPNALNTISPANGWVRLRNILLYTAGRLFLNLFIPLRNKENIKGKVWLYVVSKNNYEALYFLKEQMLGAAFVAGQNKQIGIYNKEVNRLSTRFKIFYYYKFLSVFFGLYKLKGKKALRFFDLIYQAIGYYELSEQYIRKYQPKAIVFSNDHNTDARALLLAANSLQIPTIYIQHASIDVNFPPLAFSLSLLEGQDTLNKYRQCGPIQGEVKLIGMPKADKYLSQKNTRENITTLGICANIIDETEAVAELLEQLSRHFPHLKITFRPHPGDRRDFGFIFKINPAIGFSDSKTESAFAFLQKQDALIAADTSIHLEATMLNIVSIYFPLNLQRKVRDVYGYVQQGLVEMALTLPALLSLVAQYQNNRPWVANRASYYNATIGTIYEGKSQVLAIQAIKDFLNTSNIVTEEPDQGI